MKRSLMLAVAALVASLFVGTALSAQAATTSVRADATAQTDASASPGYWASWADAASR